LLIIFENIQDRLKFVAVVKNVTGTINEDELFSEIGYVKDVIKTEAEEWKLIALLQNIHFLRKHFF
jgi:hypothetical protein